MVYMTTFIKQADYTKIKEFAENKSISIYEFFKEAIKEKMQREGI